MNYMEQLFLQILNMSLTASFIVGIVLILRVLFHKIPKIYSYVLWIIVFFRFLFPFTLESILSFIPVNKQIIIPHKVTPTNAALSDGLGAVNDVMNQVITSSSTSINNSSISPLQLITLSATLIWMLGIGIFTVVTVINYVRLQRTLQTATLIIPKSKSSCSVYETDQINSPFLLGLFQPRIYLPLGMEANERKYVLAHEQMHWSRRDYIIKLLCYLAVILHWFNPLALLSFHMMTKDMEMSCDEQVMNRAKLDIRTDYSNALFHISLKQSGIMLPLAFGESNTKERIKNVLNFKKPPIYVAIVAILVIIITAYTMLTTMNQSATKTNQDKASVPTSSVSNETNIDKSTPDQNAPTQNVTDQEVEETDNVISNAAEQEAVEQDNVVLEAADTEAVEQNNVVPKPAEQDNVVTQPAELVPDNQNFTSLINLIGISKEELIKNFNEEPVKVDEGGLEFKNAQIRVWFDENKKVAQVFLMNNQMDLNGVKIGDKISQFKEVFGEPTSEKKDDAHFKYDNVFLSVIYDKENGNTYAVYILKDDF